jgi:hypothetical protein
MLFASAFFALLNIACAASIFGTRETDVVKLYDRSGEPNYYACLNATKEVYTENDILSRGDLVHKTGFDESDTTYALSPAISTAYSRLDPIEHQYQKGYPVPSYFSYFKEAGKSNGFYVVMKNAFVLPPSADASQVCNCEVLWNAGGCSTDTKQLEVKSFLSMKDVVVQHKGGALAVLTSVWQHNYFHALVEMMTRLMSVYELLQKRPDVRVLISGNLPRNVMQLLELIGLPRSRLELVVQGERVAYFGSELIVPRGIRCGAPMRRNLVYLRSLLYRSNKLVLLPSPSQAEQAAVGSVGELTMLCFVRTNGRRVVRMGEMCKDVPFAFTPEAGTESINEKKLVSAQILLGDEPVLHVMRKVSQASLIVACHGAGLSNIVFAQPGTRVVEFAVPNENGGGCYYYMSVMLGLKHSIEFTPEADAKGGQVKVDEERFLSLVGHQLQFDWGGGH